MHNEYDISVSDGVELLIPEDEIISTCNFVLAQEKVVRPCMVSISIVSDEEIRTVNRTWRNTTQR